MFEQLYSKVHSQSVTVLNSSNILPPFANLPFRTHSQQLGLKGCIGCKWKCKHYLYYTAFKESIKTQVRISLANLNKSKKALKKNKKFGHSTFLVWLVMTLYGQLYRKGGMSQQSEEFALLFHRKRSCLARADKGCNYGESDYRHSLTLSLGRKNQVTFAKFNKYNWTSMLEMELKSTNSVVGKLESVYLASSTSGPHPSI